MASSSGQQWHGRHESATGGRFADGMASWQWLNHNDYRALKKTHGWRLDKWTRIENIGWSGTLLLRHASDGHHGTSRLEGDGMMSLNAFLNYDMNMALHATPEDVEKLIADQSKTKVRFRVARGNDGSILRIGAAQGHSQKALDQFNPESVLQRATMKDKLLKAIMIHGTKREYADKIGREGLKAGGDRGSAFRGHIHLVSSVEGTKEICGVRSGSDTLVRVDIPAYMRDGGECFWSTNEVLLTEGLKSGTENFGIPPQYIVDIVDRYSGRPVRPIPTPEVTRSGRVEGASVVARVTVTREEADRIQRQVAFTVGQERADVVRAEQRQSIIDAATDRARALVDAGADISDAHQRRALTREVLMDTLQQGGGPEAALSLPCEPRLEPAAGAESSSEGSKSPCEPTSPWDAPPSSPPGAEGYDKSYPLSP